MALSLKRSSTTSDSSIRKKLCPNTNYGRSASISLAQLSSPVCQSKPMKKRLSSLPVESSSSEAEDEEDDDCPRPKAGVFRLGSMDLSLSPAFAKYSQEDDYDEEDDDSNVMVSKPIGHRATNKHSFSLLTNERENPNSDISSLNRMKRASFNTSPPKLTDLSFLSTSSGHSSRSRHCVPESDVTARSRCFDYLIGAIDEAWARYCDATSNTEDQVYGFSKSSHHQQHQRTRSLSTNSAQQILPNTPNSIFSSDEEDVEAENNDEDNGDLTDITDYESDNNRISEKPSNLRLQDLKDKLIKSKYHLQDFVESNNIDDSLSFWKRWDLIKYSTIELVEDDDNDDVVGDTIIEELEAGRFEGSF
ncbi:Hypothetical protein PP7435_CHR4-0511 [Komagataella phaffii CBS 7435]|uniref:Uncharacterized protein n=2 Tax=Komagataella phaffii TaxID=460519 RepID=C4R7Z6_KOMPG|nr:Hypothetical protein PAS_chr4_0469 [Komagataella phaffii GS115]AOA64543.1 GQ67_04828T0 [Komagataella phaffii]CAH2450890.1 Hypothetical protein BQ9382_C4-2665 [Komagataella phaffii CBS 7435]AOA70217.1 GQ68_04800T0 [Komagataella phaffii GS115]CAY71721.1 Hypothetical protein PAS_chr4_0469 [Komagataella phaffii GS115]CCA40675.1 Hypothetical protein PP7435_CHR4-0511 [Komagataella phaffii CBS 7435]